MPAAAAHQEGCLEPSGQEREGVARGEQEGRSRAEIGGVLALCFSKFRSEVSESTAG